MRFSRRRSSPSRMAMGTGTRTARLEPGAQCDAELPIRARPPGGVMSVHPDAASNGHARTDRDDRVPDAAKIPAHARSDLERRAESALATEGNHATKVARLADRVQVEVHSKSEAACRQECKP